MCIDDDMRDMGEYYGHCPAPPDEEDTSGIPQEDCMNIRPVAGMVCAHHKGNVYIVLHIANTAIRRSRHLETVVYMGANGNIWARDMDSFCRSFRVLYDGRNKAEE